MLCSLSISTGYGHIAPETFTGRLFCVAYATVGVPFTLVFLSACVQRLLGPTESMLEFLCRFEQDQPVIRWINDLKTSIFNTDRSSLSSKTSQLSIRIIHCAIMFAMFIRYNRLTAVLFINSSFRIISRLSASNDCPVLLVFRRDYIPWTQTPA